MWILLLLAGFNADLITHKYNKGDDVVLWFSKLVPFDNPQESYSYSDLPLCTSSGNERKYVMGLGEAIEGYELQDSGLEIKFQESVLSQPFCERKLDEVSREKLIEMVKRNFWLQMFIDDLPVWSPIGEYKDSIEETYIFSNYTLLVSYNQDKIIQAKATLKDPVALNSLENIQLYYSIAWDTTDITFANRFSSYLDPGFFENNVHWFSIFNSFVMVLLLCGLVLLILYRTVNKDYDFYNSQENEISEFVETKGWKQVAGDAFKAPEFLPFFTTAVSTGWHLCFLTFFAIFTSMLHPMYTERGSSAYYLLIEYSLLGTVSGFQCGSMYTEYKGKKWFGTAIFTSFSFPMLILSIGGNLTLTATLYSSSAAIPFLTILEIGGLFFFLYLPLFFLGLMIGKRYRLKRPITQRINSIQSPILREKKFYNSPAVLITLGGILPFSSIYIEVYYIFTSFWNYKFYYVYGFTLVSFILFGLSVGCVAIVASYSTLNSEDYRWHWISFASPGSVGVYLYIYSVYFYFFKTKMTGYLQFIFYFSYITVGSIYVSLIAGAIGYTSSYYFVKRIYSNIKSE